MLIFPFQFWRYCWWPYARIITHHRHLASNAPVLATLHRFIFLALIPAFFLLFSHRLGTNLSQLGWMLLWEH